DAHRPNDSLINPFPLVSPILHTQSLAYLGLIDMAVALWVRHFEF
ncbi:4436_t:CDS:1, partial [Racocetra persica]